MWLLLTEPSDPTGAWLREGLAERTAQPVVHLTSADVRTATVAERREGPGGPWFRLGLADGRMLDSRDLRGVINRVWALPPGLAMRMNLPDRRHVVHNFTVPLMRWLHEFPGIVLNRPTAQGISGDYRRDGEWSMFADRIGFMSAPESALADSQDQAARGAQVAVIGSTVVPLDEAAGALSSFLAEKCLRLAAAAKINVLGIEAVRRWPRDWRFVTASVWPDLPRGGSRVLDALVQALIAPPRPVLPTTRARPRSLQVLTP